MSGQISHLSHGVLCKQRLWVVSETPHLDDKVKGVLLSKAFTVDFVVL